ncbi:hypothetical protein D3C87_846760 [compost metagenome]
MSARIDPIGGQAVIEGVMMRGLNGVGVAVRSPEGEIHIKQESLVSWRTRFPILKLPFVRGVAALVESMTVGIRMLNYSASVATGETEETKGGGWFGMVVGLGIAIFLFKFVPALALEYLKPIVGNLIALNAIEGLIRMSIFLAYLLGISRFEEVKRLFQYHGAEHQVINCMEAGKEVTVDNALAFSPIHPRCGTSFLLVTLLMSIVVFSVISLELGAIERTLAKLALLPVVAGLAFELIRLAGKTSTDKSAGFLAWAAFWLTAPGMWLQRVTTRPASADQIEVAIASLNAALAIQPEVPLAERQVP